MHKWNLIKSKVTIHAEFVQSESRFPIETRTSNAEVGRERSPTPSQDVLEDDPGAIISWIALG
jgi:hypothetical protein